MQMGKETSEREPTRAGENYPTPTSARSACEISRVSFCKKGANSFPSLLFWLYCTIVSVPCVGFLREGAVWSSEPFTPRP